MSLRGLDLYRDTVRWISNFKREHGYSPTMAEIANGYGVNVTAIQGRLFVMEERGIIKTTPRVARSIVVLMEDF